jgi:hypothetical protein
VDKKFEQWISGLCKVNFVLLTSLTKKKFSKFKLSQCVIELESIAKDIRRTLE